jgi:uncharacterized protein (DUF169 family)
MCPTTEDLSVFDRFNFEKPPVGVKFLFSKPDDIQHIGKSTCLCEMVREAQESRTPFYVASEDQSCKPGSYVWGSESLGVFDSGQFGAAMKIFKEPRANVRLHQHIPRLDKKTIRFIAFSRLDQLSFTPDLLVILADRASQTEILLRAMTYTTGEPWSSKTTCVMGCAWLLAYPYITGKVNYFLTGFGSGMKAKKLFPENRQLISIPYNWLPTIIENLREMPWVLPAWEAEDVGAFVKQLYTGLGIPPSP